MSLTYTQALFLAKAPFPFSPLPLLPLSSLYHCLTTFFCFTLFLSLHFCFFSLSVFASLYSPLLQKNKPASLSRPPIFAYSLLPTEFSKRENAVEAPVSSCSAQSGLVFTVFNFVRTEYRADVLNIDQPTQTAGLSNPAHVEPPCAVVYEGRWVSEFSAFSVADKSPPVERRIYLPPPVDAKLAVPLYLTDSSVTTP